MTITVFPRWGCERSFYTPSVPKPFADGAILDAGSVRPLRNRHGFPIKRDQCVAAFVVILRSHICPSAVFRRIAGIIVDSVQRHTARPRPHVVQKVFKDHPSFANGDASAAVPSVLFVTWIKAALFHGSPCVIGRGFDTWDRMTMPSVDRAVLAMTAFDISSSDMRDCSFSQFSAMLTFKDGPSTAVASRCVFNKRKRAKLRASKKPLIVRHSCHANSYLNLGTAHCTGYWHNEQY